MFQDEGAFQPDNLPTYDPKFEQKVADAVLKFWGHPIDNQWLIT